jgi:hypothetical protein
MQCLSSRIAGDDKIRVISKPLQAAVPNIAMNIIIGADGKAKKLNVPRGSQHEPEYDDAS